MDSMKKALKEMFGQGIQGVELERGKCEGCGNEKVVWQRTILAGPRKGATMIRETGCVCWEIEQGRQALEEHKRFLSGDK